MQRMHVVPILIILWAVCFLTLSGGVLPWQLASSVKHMTASLRAYSPVCVCVCVRAFACACISMSHTENQHQSKTVKVEKVSGAQNTSILTLRIPSVIKILTHSAS